MELFERLRVNIGTAKLNKKLAGIKRNKSFTNFKSVKEIGVVWDASFTEDFGKLSDFVRIMQSRNIHVEILGYFPGKELPDNYTAIRYLKCFKRHDINVFFTPVSDEVMEFISKPYDILIDINFRKRFPLSYVSSLSMAKFKIGLLDTKGNKSPFDLMMEINNNTDLDNYISQVVYYLEMINGSVNSSDRSFQNIKN